MKEKVVLAYSGGLDSTFLLKVCHDVLGDNVIAVSIRTDLQPVREYLGSEEFVGRETGNCQNQCRQSGIPGGSLAFG